jgi:hypothetical protein
MYTNRWSFFVAWPVATLLLCVLGPIRVYDGVGLPITLQSFAVVPIAKREWVGLHWDDMPEEYAGDRSFLVGANWAEARLKEKNGG